MPFGASIGQLLGLVREVRALDGETARIVVSGEGAAHVASALAAGGEPGAVSVGGDPLTATAAVMLVAGDPSSAETAVLRGLARAQKPVVVVRRGGGTYIANVLPGDVLEIAGDVPIPELAAAIARTAGDEAAALSARLPVLRPAVERRLIGATSLENAALAASPWLQQAHLPLLSLAQARMALLLGLNRGEALPREPQGLAATALPSLVGAFGVGFGARALVRRLPVRGPLVQALVAYGCTRAVAAARLRL